MSDTTTEWEGRPRSAKKTITQAEYLQLVGLLTLTKGWNRKINDCCEAAVAITQERNREGELNTLGHTYDACWSGEVDVKSNVDDLLRKLEITVERHKEGDNDGTAND